MKFKYSLMAGITVLVVALACFQVNVMPQNFAASIMGDFAEQTASPTVEQVASETIADTQNQQQENAVSAGNGSAGENLLVLKDAIAEVTSSSANISEIVVADKLSSTDEVDAYTKGASTDELSHVLVQVEWANDSVKYAVSVTAAQNYNPDLVTDYSSDQVSYGTNQTTSAFNTTLTTGWASMAEQIDVSSFGYVESDIAEKYYNAIIDNPEYFNVPTTFRYGSYDGSTIAIILPAYLASSTTEYETMKTNYENAVQNALSSINDNMTDQAKIYVLHKWLCQRTIYNYAAAAEKEVSDWSNFTAYGTLVNKTGVCQSYSMALSALLDRAGVEATTLMVGPMTHAWNEVKLDGRWYHIDTTWDDPSNDATGFGLDYFLKSDTYMEETGKASNNNHHDWKLGASYADYGWDSSLNCTDTRYDSYNWTSYDPTTDVKNPTHTHTAGTAVQENVVAATCTATGSYDLVVRCTSCNAEMSRSSQKINALGHNYTSAVTEPTCTEKGYTTHTCTRGDDSYVDTYVDAKGHTEVVDAAVSATCTAEGKTEGKHCSVCNTVTQAQTAISALGHAWGDWQVTEEATTTKTGTANHACTRSGCNVTETKTIAKTPTTTDTLPSDKAMVSKPVSTDESNALDKDKSESKYSAFKFDYVKFSIVNTSDGTEDHDTSLNITVSFPDGIDANNFSEFYFGIIHIKADGTTEEIKPQVDASGLHFTTTFSPFAIGYQSKASHTHNCVDDNNAVAATCTGTGLTASSHCSVCDEKVTAQNVVPALGHDQQWKVSTRAATIATKGICQCACSRCGFVAQTNEYMLGDVNNNGEVNIVDAQIVLDMANGKWAAAGNSAGYDGLLTALNNGWNELTLVTAANCNGIDSDVDALDARAIQKSLHGK